MPTTVHIPAPLLAALDRRARSLHVSRNRLIVRAVERELTDKSAWPEEFFTALRGVNAAQAADVDELLAHLRTSRRSKRPTSL